MAKLKEAGQSEASNYVDLILAIIAGNLAGSLAVNGVMAGAHDNLIGLQSHRIKAALVRTGVWAEVNPELIDEPITEKAFGLMFEIEKKIREADLVELQRAAGFAAAEAAKPKPQAAPPAG